MGTSGYSGQLLLQHSDIGNQYRATFKELREAEELLDVTLACEDDTLDVHKVVLSACSPFFRKVLLKTKQNHPFIYMKGIKFEYLKVIVDFVYNGEAFIAAEDLDQFLEAAQELQITGLASEELEQNKPSEKLVQNRASKNLSTGPAKEKREKLELTEIRTVKKEKDEESMSIALLETECKPSIDLQDVKIHISDETLEELKEEINKNMECGENSDGVKSFSCKICGKEFRRKEKASAHIESHLDQFTFDCEFCSKVMKTRNGLRSHIIYNHTKKNK